MTHLVIGHTGEVGSALFKLINDSGLPVNGIDLRYKSLTNDCVYDFIHICLNRSPSLFKTTKAYVDEYAGDNSIIVVHSTVEPGTTSKLNRYFGRVVYSPVRGKHPDLIVGLKHHLKFFATINEKIVLDVIKMFQSIGITSVPLIEDPTSLEFAKPYNTNYFLKNITFMQDLFLIVEKYDLSINTISKFINSTGDRNLLPYVEKVGGHCLIPNAENLKNMGSDLSKFMIDIDTMFVDKFGNEIKKVP